MEDPDSMTGVPAEIKQGKSRQPSREHAQRRGGIEL